MSYRHYSAQFLDHFDHPRHVGILDLNDSRVSIGYAQTNAEDEKIQFQLKIDNYDIIKNIAWHAIGNPVIIAGCSLYSELVFNKSLIEAQQIKADEIAEKLAVPKLRWNSILLVEEALQKAIQKVSDRY